MAVLNIKGDAHEYVVKEEAKKRKREEEAAKGQQLAKTTTKPKVSTKYALVAKDAKKEEMTEKASKDMN